MNVSVHCASLEGVSIVLSFKKYCYSLFALYKADCLIPFSRQACDNFWEMAAILIVFIQWWQISGR